MNTPDIAFRFYGWGADLRIVSDSRARFRSSFVEYWDSFDEAKAAALAHIECRKAKLQAEIDGMNSLGDLEQFRPKERENQ